MRSISWILSLMLLLASSLAPAAHIVLVKAQSLTMREKPSKNGKSIDKLVTYQPVELLKTEGDWAQVKTAGDKTGYVQSAYLTPSAFVYTGPDKVNGRQGPGTQYDTWLEYNEPNQPLRVLDATDSGWLMVMDFEGDRSWVSSKGIHTSGRYVITKEPITNARKGVGIGQDLAFKAPKGLILKVLEEKDGWLHVKYTDGDEGWLSAKTVFGWLDVDAPGGGKSGAADSASAGKAASDKGASEKTGSEKASSASKTSAKKKSSGSGASSGESASTTGKASAKKKSGGDSDDEDSATSGKATAKKKARGGSDDSDSAGGKASAAKASVKKKSGGDSDDDDAASSKTSTKKKTSAGSSARRTKRSSSTDDDEASASSKPASRASASKAGAVRSVSLRSDSKDSDSDTEGSSKTSSRRTRSRKTPSNSDE